jgi:polar amino acid transport system ATP-binding protein
MSAGAEPGPLPAASDEAVRIEGLHKSFGANEVLKGIDLSVATHEVVCLIGASGSGKSTLLRCVNLLEPINSGRISLWGQEITRPDIDPNLVRRHVGIVFQSFNLFPHMTVLQNVTLAPAKVPGFQRPRPKRKPGRCWAGSGWRTRKLTSRIGCREGSSSGSRSSGHWR